MPRSAPTPIIKPKEDESWKTNGRTKFLTRDFMPPDREFVSDWDFDTLYADKLIQTSQMGLSGQFIIISPTVTSSTVLDDTDPVTNQAIFTLTTKTPASNLNKNLVVPDMSIYVGSVAGANLLPGGSSIDESEWQVVGPWNDWHSSNGQIYTSTRVYIRNVGAGSSATVIVKADVRLIASKNTAKPVGVA